MTKAIRNITVTDFRGSGAKMSTVPTVHQMMAENARNKAAERRTILEGMTEEQVAESIRANMPMTEMIKGLNQQLHQAYPDASFFLIGTKPTSKDYTAISFEYSGNEGAMAAALCETMQHSQLALRVFNTALRLFCSTSGPQEAEQAITALQDIIMMLKRQNSIENQIRLKEAEAKRLRKAGRMDLVKLKEQEIAELRDYQRRKAKRQAQRIASLEKAREALAEKRRKAKNRQNQKPQVNFAKMAKEARRKKAEARSARKKSKAGGGNGDNNVRSCSQLLN